MEKVISKCLLRFYTAYECARTEFIRLLLCGPFDHNFVCNFNLTFVLASHQHAEVLCTRMIEETTVNLRSCSSSLSGHKNPQHTCSWYYCWGVTVYDIPLWINWLTCPYIFAKTFSKRPSGQDKKKKKKGDISREILEEVTLYWAQVNPGDMLWPFGILQEAFIIKD